uniref:(northern house mosquito) hypothetical protein n=1 Tax=Culex pipiens TaxID=7175 RepID=A0A8D8E234_CULPI
MMGGHVRIRPVMGVVPVRFQVVTALQVLVLLFDPFPPGTSRKTGGQREEQGERCGGDSHVQWGQRESDVALGWAFVLTGRAVDLAVAPEFRRDAGLQFLAFVRAVVARVDLHPRELVLVAFDVARFSGAFELDYEVLGDFQGAELVRVVPPVGEGDHVGSGGAEIAGVFRIVR